MKLLIAAYFFNGATFNWEPEWGIFYFMEEQHFADFVYQGLMLLLGLVLSFLVTSKLFHNPMIPACVMTFEPMVSTMFISFF
jgi:uncharacterized protein YacL